MTKFFRDVTLSVVRDESRQSRASCHPCAFATRLANGGRWLNDDDRHRLNTWTDARPNLHTVCGFREQLALLMEQRDISAGMQGLSQWVRAARDSDIPSLRIFAAALAKEAMADSR